MKMTKISSILWRGLDKGLYGKSNHYIREETKEEFQEYTTENKGDELMTSFQRDGQSKENKKIQ